MEPASFSETLAVILRKASVRKEIKSVANVLNASEAPVEWRVTDPEIFEALCRLGPDQVVTDGLVYQDRYDAYRVVEAYRVRLRYHRRAVRMRCRIVSVEGGYQWFARAEPRPEESGR